MIIGLNGPIGSGKSEVARILEKNWGFKAVGFADKLKESASALFPDLKAEDWEVIKNDPSSRISIQWGENIGDGAFVREISVTGREFLKRYGTEAHRDAFGSEFWVDMLLNRENSKLFSADVAIYDARFDNELERIGDSGGYNIQVRRPGHEFNPSHPSEAPPNPDLIDFIIINDGTLEELEDKVNDLVRAERLASHYQLGDSNTLAPSP